jgi:hypothetical protein
MPAKIVPTDRQVLQMNLDRLSSIFKLPPEYYVAVRLFTDPRIYDSDDQIYKTYVVKIGKSPKQVTVSNNGSRLFHKETFKTVTRYTAIAKIIINPLKSVKMSNIRLTGTEEENELITKMIDEASSKWIFSKGEIKDINLEVNVFPESEENYFDIE